MIIRVLSTPPQPTVLFCVAFKDLPKDLPPPPGWLSQLQQLLRDDLEAPKTIHALDKSVGIINLLEEVVLDIPALSVSCKFVDGVVEIWPLVSSLFLASLENIIKDVYEATLEDEKTREHEKAAVNERDRKVRFAPTSVKVRHKKQRSFFMTIVSSIINVSSPVPPSPTRASSPLPVTGTPTRSSCTPSILRRRARSAIVDTFRLHVLSELSQRFPRSGYYEWALRSTLRRTMLRMEQIIDQVPATSPYRRSLEHQSSQFSATTMNVPSLYSDEDNDDDTSVDTDTDGSSIRTPSSSHFDNRGRVLHTTNPGPGDPQSRRTPEPMQHYFCPADLDEYRFLSDAKETLQHLIMISSKQAMYDASDEKQYQDILEIRSRRRAWSNLALSGSGVKDFGLATPTRSSQLAQYSWTSEEFEYVPEVAFVENSEPPGLTMERMSPTPRRTRVSTGGCLFPVSEEDEEELEANSDVDAESLCREPDPLQQDFEYDLEGGVRCRNEDDSDGTNLRIALEVERAPNIPRMRTSSMYQHRRKVDAPQEVYVLTHPSIPEEVASKPHSDTSGSAVTSHPDGNVIELASDLNVSGRTTVFAEMEVSVGELELSGYGNFGSYSVSGDEFTLAMDLPVKIRSSDVEVRRTKHAFNVGIVDVTVPREVDSEWTQSELADGTVLHCR